MSNFKLLKSEETQNTIAKTFKHFKNCKPLPSLPNGNCCIEYIENENALILWSYNTRVFAYLVEKDTIILPSRLYSATTTKHIITFLNDYIYHTSIDFIIKLIQDNIKSFNYKTGEINEFETGYID